MNEKINYCALITMNDCLLAIGRLIESKWTQFRGNRVGFKSEAAGNPIRPADNNF